MKKIIMLILLIYLIFSCTKKDDVPDDKVSSRKPGADKKSIYLISGSPETSFLYIFTEAVYIEAFKRLGYEYKSLFLPTKRAIIDADLGKYDGLVARIPELNIDNEYPNLVMVNEPIYEGSSIVVISKIKDLTINKWEDLTEYNYIVAYKRGTKKLDLVLDTYVDKDKIVITDDTDQSLKMLLNGRIDIIIEPYDTIEKALVDEKFINEGIIINGSVGKTQLFPFLHKKHSDLLVPLAKALQEVKKDGTYQKIYKNIKAVKKNEK